MGVKKGFAVFLLFLLVAGVLAYLFAPNTLWELIASVAGNETASEILGFNPYNTTGNATRTPRPPPDAPEQYSFLRDGYWDNKLVQEYWENMPILDRTNKTVRLLAEWAGKILFDNGGPTFWDLRQYKNEQKARHRTPNATIDYGTYYDHPAKAFYGNVSYEYLFNGVYSTYGVDCNHCSYTSGAWYFKYRVERLPEYGVEIRVLAWRHTYNYWFTGDKGNTTGLVVLVYARIYNMTAFIAKVADLTYLTGPQMGRYVAPSLMKRWDNIYYGGARFYSDIGTLWHIGNPAGVIFLGNISKWRVRHALIVFDLSPVKDGGRRLYHYGGHDYPVEVVVAMDEPLIETTEYATYDHRFATRLPLMPADELYWTVAGGPAFGLALNFALPANSTWPDWVREWHMLVDQLKNMNSDYRMGTMYGTEYTGSIIPMYIHFTGVCADWAYALDEFTADALGFPVAFYASIFNRTETHAGGVLILPKEAIEELNRTMPDYVAKHVNATMLDLDHDGHYEYGVFGVMDAYYRGKGMVDKIYILDGYPPYGFYAHLTPLDTCTVYEKIYDFRGNIGVDKYIAGLPAIYHPPWYKEFVNYTVDAYQYKCLNHPLWHGRYCVEDYNPWDDTAKWKIPVHYRPPVVYINQCNPKYQLVVRSPWIIKDAPVAEYGWASRGVTVNFSFWLVNYPLGHDYNRNKWYKYRIPPGLYREAFVDLYHRYWSRN